MAIRILGFFIAIVFFAATDSARAHPHVWITMKTELIYAPDGTVTGVRHHWAFDDLFSAFATQGIARKEGGPYTREGLAPLAKVNVESLKEYDYFTYVTADGKKVALTDPTPDYWLEDDDTVLTVNFTLPLKTPVKAKELKVEVYDPTIFIDFEWAKGQPVHLIGAPHCKANVVLPREMTVAEGRALSDIPADQTTRRWPGARCSQTRFWCIALDTLAQQ